MAVLPLAPVKDPQLPDSANGLDTSRLISNDAGGNPGNDSSPQIAVDRYNPNKLVAVWTDHNIAGSPEPEYQVKGAFSTNGGLSWTPLAGLPAVMIDPSSGSNPHPYDRVSRPTVAFDASDNFYVLEIQQSADQVTAGDVLLKPYSFSGATPVAGATVDVYGWNRSATVPIVKAVRDAVIGVDDNLPSFTDPATGITQTDAGSGRVYIAWEEDVPVPSGFPANLWNLNSMELLTSTNGGLTFGAPIAFGGPHAAGRSDYEADAAPRIAISQGRPAGTLSPTDAGVTGGQVTVVFDDFHSNGDLVGAPAAIYDVIWAATFTPTSIGTSSVGRKQVALSSVRGAANSPYPLASPSSPIGIGPGAVIASDNTLGASPHAGRLYVAYTDRYDTTRFPQAGGNPADNTDIRLMFSDDGGQTWKSAGQVNDDDALTDGFSAGITPSDPNFKSAITGRPQYLPQIAVDPATGTVAISYEDTRYDPTKSRTVESIQISGDGGTTFSKSTYADATLSAYDQTTGRTVPIGPIPSNQANSPDAPAAAQGGLGDRQGLAIYDGRLYVAFATNMDGGSNTFRKTEIHVAPMTYQTGPRVISSTMGQVVSQTVTDLNGNTITFNNTKAADGTPVADGFIVTFDRPVDAATFTRGDITITYRDPSTPGSSPGIPVPLTSDPVPLNDGSTPSALGGSTKFLVRFPGQSFVGTYSYTVGPNIRDLSRNTLATNLYYADQSTSNLPLLPPVGTGGSGVPSNDNAKSTLTIANVPVNQNILDLDVLVSLQHASDSDLVLKLIPPPGYLPANGNQFILLSQNEGGGGADFTDTTFDAQALTSIAAGAAPFTGHFRPEATGVQLSALIGKSPNGLWTLEIDDTKSGSSGKLLSWGLKVTTSNRSFDGKFTQAGVAALSPNVGTNAFLSPGHLMDQNGDGLGGQNPNTGGQGVAGSEIVGLAPGDIYAVPTPNPIDPEVFNGQNVNPPFSPTTLPLMISGPHIVNSYVPGTATTKTPDNLVTDKAVLGFDIVFDRNMDPNTITVGNHVARISTPYGVYAPGDRLPDGSTLAIQIVADPNGNPNSPDPDPTHPRTYQVQFFKILPGGSTPVVFPQTESGTYSVTLTSDVQSANGDALDTNQNAGLDFLRGTASAGTLPQTYSSQAPVPLDSGPVGTTYTSVINVPDSFLVKNVTVKLDIDYPQDNLLTASLVSPDGFSVLLFSNVGSVGNGRNFTNTILDDAADTPIANGGPPFFGSFNPQLPLSQFKDHFSQGVWKLEITVSGTPVGVPGITPQIRDWSLTLSQPLSNSGLGEAVADQSTQSFRIFTFDATNPLSANSWTAVSAGEGAKSAGTNAEVAGRVGALAVDPSDASGNTVYVAGASGGIWKTTNFLTKDPTGPIYTPLIDAASTYGLNIGSIAIFPRNNDPNQSIIFAATGDASVLGDNVRDQMGTQRGIGFLRSMDGGKSWTLLDSQNNTGPFASRDHFFASVAGQAGITSFKIVVDPKLSPSGNVIVYAALADIDANGQRVTSGPKGGIWKSLDSGNTWTLMRGGQATDITLDYKSVNKDSGNLDFLYAAFRGDGVYFSPNGAQNFDLMTGTVGDPLIQDADFPQPQPVGVVFGDTPNGKSGNIVLAKPNLTGNDLSDKIYQGWLYAAVVNDTGGSQPVISGGSGFVALYLTKDFGQTWTKVAIPALTTGAPEIPTNNNATSATIPISGTTTPAGSPFTFGNFALSLVTDPNNPNVVYLGGSNEFRPTGLIRVDTTGIHDAHAFFTDPATVTTTLRTTNSTDGGVVLRSATQGIGGLPVYDPIADPFINLIRDPNDPFNADATVLVQNTAGFTNDGSHTSWTRLDRAVAPNPYASALDPWSVPTTRVHQMVTYTDPLTGQSRLIFATDQGVYTAVTDGSGKLVGSIGNVASNDTASGNQTIVTGTRNGNLDIAQVYQGASQASQLAAQMSVLQGFFYSATQDGGISQSDPNIINKGTAGYGNLSGDVTSINGATVDREVAYSIATQQTFKSGDAGTVYAYRPSESLVSFDGRPSTDTVQVNSVGKTFRLYQTANGGDTPDSQWPFRPGYNVVVNPLSADQMLISSQAGRVFATTTRGNVWSEIGNPGALDGTNAQALAYGAPDPTPPGGGLGALNNYIFAGTKGGKIFVTFTAGGGAGNAWKSLSAGLDGSPVQMIVTDPTRGSHDAYAVTSKGVYRMADSVAGGSWVNITGNLFSVLRGQFNDPTLGTQVALASLNAIQADWRYLIPDDFTNPSGPTHPMLYVAGQGGVFRSYDNGQNWTLFPDGTTNVDGTINNASLLNSPLGNGGGLPNTIVTDLDLSLGNIDPTTGRPDVSTGPNTLMASTFGRGTYAIRLAPIVFPNTPGNSQILALSTTQPPPAGSDSGFINTDQVTNITTPVINGLSEQSAFGNSVNVALYDVSDTTIYTQDAINAILAGLPTLPDGTPTPKPIAIPLVAGTTQTDSTGHFAVQVAPGYFKAFDPNNPNAAITDGAKRLLVQATDSNGTKGNFAPLGKLLTSNFGTTGTAQINDPTAYSFILDTTPPVSPATPDLTDASDAGLSQTDNITNITKGLAFTVQLSTGEPASTHVYLVRDNDSTIVDEKFGTAAPGQITLTDPGPVSDGTHFYYAYETDLAGNKGPISGKLTVIVDTVAPNRPNAPILDPSNPTGGSDSGVVGDNITNVNRPYFSGFAAEPGGFLQIVDATGNPLGPVLGTPPPQPIPQNVAANGRYSVQTQLLADGSYSLRAQQEDIAGNLSLPSAPINITILSQTPTTPTLFLVAADDSGIVGDNITNVSQPRLTGSAKPGLSVKLVLDSGTIKDASGNVIPVGGTIAPATGATPIIVASDGSYLIKFPTKLADGKYTVHTVVSDIAGNMSSSAPLNLQILGGDGGSGTGTGNPPTPNAPTLALNPADDSGVKGDNTTVVRRPRLIGVATYPVLDANGQPVIDPVTGLPKTTPASGVTIELVTTAGQLLALATSSTSGSYTMNLPNDLIDGKLSVMTRIRDIAGNPGPNSNVVTLSIVSAAGDVNNDGLADLNSFSRTTSQFTFTLTSASGSTSAAVLHDTSGLGVVTLAGDIPFTGDFDGDGKLDYGFYRPSTAHWYVTESRAGAADFSFGTPNQTVPVPADFDGDGLTDFATWNTVTGLWTVFQSKTGTLKTASFGVAGDQPVPADYDGDGKADYAVYRSSSATFFAAFSSGLTSGVNGAFLPPTAALPAPHATLGNPGTDAPVVGDYDGDGKADIATFNPTSGLWSVALANGGKQSIKFPIVAGDIPVPADYDGDGKVDYATYRPSDSTWRIIGTSAPGRILVSGATNSVPLLAPLQYRTQKTGIITKAVIAPTGSDFSTQANAGPDLGAAASKFAATTAGKASTPANTAPVNNAKKAPAQASAKPKADVITRFGHPDDALHAAALEKLGKFTVLRKKKG